MAMDALYEERLLWNVEMARSTRRFERRSGLAFQERLHALESRVDSALLRSRDLIHKSRALRASAAKLREASHDLLRAMRS